MKKDKEKNSYVLDIRQLLNRKENFQLERNFNIKMENPSSE
jgi:hypothetical protein